MTAALFLPSSRLDLQSMNFSNRRIHCYPLSYDLGFEAYLDGALAILFL